MYLWASQFPCTYTISLPLCTVSFYRTEFFVSVWGEITVWLERLADDWSLCNSVRDLVRSSTDDKKYDAKSSLSLFYCFIGLLL